MNEISPGLAILSSMITPAVLILASGSLIMTTSQRLSRVIERVRKISQEFMQIEKSHDRESANEAKRRILYSLLKKSAKRSKLLTRAMTFLYISLGLFVATSLTIGIVGVTHLRYTWIPTAIGMIGAVTLFISSAILIVESRLTYNVIADEVDFVIESSKSNAPESLKKELKRSWRSWLGL
jgi:hypothetical protein